MFTGLALFVIFFVAPVVHYLHDKSTVEIKDTFTDQEILNRKCHEYLTTKHW